VAALDFTMAIKKLKASVDDSGKEIMKVRERKRGRERERGAIESSERDSDREGTFPNTYHSAFLI
jgi:hypothetical protein